MFRKSHMFCFQKTKNVLSMSDILLRAMRTPSLKSSLTNRHFGLISLALSIMVSLSLKKDNRMIMSLGPPRL